MQWNRALELLDEMKGNRISPNTMTYNAAVRACSRCEQWEEALELA